MVMLFVAHQQVQVGLGHPGDQFGALERQAFRMFGLNNHQDAANGLHDRRSPAMKRLALLNYSCCEAV
ncbi:hypothetical protein D3C84_1049740 [compost metagenome]